MKNLILFILVIPCMGIAQSESTVGIQWSNNLSWQEVREKAKKENKYIFLDIYATWCAPCKKMDKEVYLLDSVGQFFNSRYISVKVQMDQTPKDDHQVIAWRNDAKAIQNKFHIREFPSYLFFSPEGMLVDKQIGYHPPTSFMKMGRMALTPGLVYLDPLANFERMIAEYKSGIKKYDSIYYLYKTAKRQGALEVAANLEKDIDSYLERLREEQLYTKEKLDYMRSVTVRKDSKWYSFFLKNTKKINAAVGNVNYAQCVIDEVILKNLAYNYVKMQPPGMMMFSGKAVPIDATEADWKGLEQKIRKEFNSYYARRVTLATKFVWYKQHWNLPSFLNSYFSFIDRYGVDSHDWTSLEWINNVSYLDVFVTISDQKILKKAISIMHSVVEKRPASHTLDTYASLLYKAGRKQEAIEWQEKAMEKAKERESTASSIPALKLTLEKMKQGQKLI